MPYVTEPFQAFLTDTLSATDVNLPLAPAAYADLLNLLSNTNDYTYLAIKDSVNYETVKVRSLNNCYLVVDRGLAKTTPAKFSYGACVSTIAPTALAIIEDMQAALSNSLKAYIDSSMQDCDFYYNPDVMGGTLSFAFTDLPQGTVGKPWRGDIVLGGTLPITAKVTDAPVWATVKQYDNMIEFTGTPSVAATTNVTVEAHSNQENKTIKQQFSIVVR